MSSPIITKIYPWVDFMPGNTNAGQLMCIIRFNMQVNEFIIKNITLVNGKCEEYIHDISKIDGYKYEIRGNDVIIRCGPQWLITMVTAKITIEYNETEYNLVSQPQNITETC